MNLTANRASGPYVLHEQERGIGAKLLRVMKLTTILMLAFCLHTSAKGVAQQTITFSGREVSLENVFNAIKKQTSYRFFFNTDAIPRTTKVTIDVKNAPIEQVMHLALKDQPLTFAIKGRTIFIMKKEDIKTSFVEEQQPPIDVKGRVVNENGEPVEGVTVTIKGTNFSISTNPSGEFLVKTVEENATLIFTSVNMETFEIGVKGRQFLDVKLQTKVTSMQEIVINKGYYTERKRLATGNVSTIKSKDIQNQPVQNPLLALVGRVPGLVVEQATGFANSGVIVRIQGRNSINSGLDPLYVIDGVPYLSQPLPTIGLSRGILGNSGGSSSISSGGGNPLNFINPQDIESIDVLKDADATAIYGSRGANGVILINTKKGKAGQTKFNASFRSGWGSVPKKLDLLTTQQYLEMRQEAYLKDGTPVPNQSITPSNTNYDLTVWDQNGHTDWQEELIGGSALYTDAQVGISGGNVNTQFLIGAGYHKETTVLPGDFSDKKGSIQFSINHTGNNQKFKVQTSGTYVVDNNQIPNRDLTLDAMRLAPNAPFLYNPDGTLNWEPVSSGSGTVSTWTNPLSYLYSKYSNKVNNFIGNAQLSYQLYPGLVIRSGFGFTNLQYDEVSINPHLSIRPELRPTTNRTASYGNGRNSSWIIEPQATYSVQIGQGKLETLIGSSFQQVITKSQPVAGSGYSSDLLLENLRSAATVTALTPYYSLYKYNAIFGRFNYNFKDRYIINITARRDGSSRFGSENLFNNFWGAAGSWIFTNEKWLSSNLSFLNFGKLRVSYGTTGNDQIGDYGFMNLYNPVSAGVPYQSLTAMAPDRHTNPYLQWEETKKFQVGIDIGLISDRITFNLNYYHNRSSNLLVQNMLSFITGFDRINENFEGVIQNTGWEFALNTYNFRSRDFSWSTNLNLTIPNHNGKLISFPNLSSTIYANTYAVGKSINDVKRYQFLGIEPLTGAYQFVDENGNPTLSPQSSDLISYSNISQRLYGGIQNNISYKGVELDFTFQFVKKDAPVYYGDRPGVFNGTGNSGNQPTVVLSRWEKANDVAKLQRFSATYPSNLLNSWFNFQSSNASFTDASFIRLTNLALAWQIPEKWKKVASLKDIRLFINGQNLFTITKYKGLDPSTGSSTTLPPLRVFTIGGQVTF